MSIWAIVPVKPLRLAKSRLASVLTPEQRQRFAETMLRHVLQVLNDVPQITGTLVISRDNRALALARDYGAKTVQESGAPELNAALMRATQIIGSWGSEAVLILPADLPLIETSDVTGIIKAGDRFPSVVLSTDRNTDGTNALFIRPPGLIEYTYGEGSFRRHAMQARDVGAHVKVYESQRLLQDIDLPEDIANFYRVLHRGQFDATLPLADVFEAIQAELERRSAS